MPNKRNTLARVGPLHEYRRDTPALERPRRTVVASSDPFVRSGTSDDDATLPSWVGTAVVPIADLLSLAGMVVIVGPSLPVVAYALLALLALHLTDPRGLRLSPRVSEDLGAIIRRLAIPLLLIAPVAVQQQRTSAMIHAFAIAVGLAVVGRLIAYTVLTRLRSRASLASRTLIIGSGPVAQKLGRTFAEHPEYGIRTVGYVDDAPPAGLGASVVGSPSELPYLLDRYDVERVVVAFGGTKESLMVPVLRACDEHRVAVYHVPRFFELGGLPDMPEHDDVWGVPLVRFRRSALRPGARYAKRALDLSVSTLALLALGPLMAVIALLVRLTSSGPVLFRQPRIGKDGGEFELLKFRTMCVNDDSDVTWSAVGDARVTPLGSFLRSSSLDELPQLINVLRGEMSLVGPRPERRYFVERFGAEIHGYHDRHRVPVGITGWSQVHGLRGDTSIEQRARLDNYYIENWSLWLDVVIITRTLRSLRTAA